VTVTSNPGSITKALSEYVAPFPQSNVVPFVRPDWPLKGKPAAGFAASPLESLAEGIRAPIEEIRSAALAVPASVIAEEGEWMRCARALAHEATLRPREAEQLWDILDAASRMAPNYDEADNRTRWERYQNEAQTHPDPITLATIFHLARQNGWQGWFPPLAANPTAPPGTTTGSTTGSGSSPTGTAGPTGQSGPASGTGAAFALGNPCRAIPVAALPQIPPKRLWLHGTDLVRGAVSLIVAPGGRAKSTWLIACALACASGRALLDAHVFGGPLRVLYISTEDSSSEMALRIRAAMSHHQLTDADVPGLSVIGAERWGLPLLHAIGNAPQIYQPGWAALIAELDQAKPDVLAIDPLINAMGGVSTNENSAAALMMGQLAATAATRSISVILAHHASKGRDPLSAESAMGAATFTNLARIVLGIEPLGGLGATRLGVPPWEAKSIFRVVGTKQNFSPPNATDRWFRLLTVEVQNAQPPVYPNGDRVAVVEPFHPGASAPKFPPDMIRDALLAVDAADPLLSPSKNSRNRYAAPAIAAAIAPHRGGSRSEIEGQAVIDHLLETALVKVDEVIVARPGSRSDKRKGLVLTPAGKLAIAVPQSPQSPADTPQDIAGGEPPGSPAGPGGCGGNAGTAITGDDGSPNEKEN
jgi:AAA domain/Primase C terminal 2 (PriCT-2)